MKFKAHNYEAAREDAAKRSKDAGKKLLPVLGYTNGVPHYLMEDGQRRDADFKRRDVSGKALRKERLAQRAKFREYRNGLVAQFGPEKAQEIINEAVKAARPQRPV